MFVYWILSTILRLLSICSHRAQCPHLGLELPHLCVQVAPLMGETGGPRQGCPGDTSARMTACTGYKGPILVTSKHLCHARKLSRTYPTMTSMSCLHFGVYSRLLHYFFRPLSLDLVVTWRLLCILGPPCSFCRPVLFCSWDLRSGKCFVTTSLSEDRFSVDSRPHAET